ncbi:acyl carrier protein [Catenulispora acidiphila DSM 44928]|uniref:Acyl carrier protein n=1 Tax=Catenulispora acidiphila (strain DSM 44928 / JCM 14897 / NBRC 102108 / NRRL B-24433 / ID139908) TaxID=479433 RepID=C7Q5R7_CATAD|nr:acyl carrier protein [Catenulispora acidiphila]ACU70014.1 acyl carrier protein [Catenulispora acidiphila DSM 44928]
MSVELTSNDLATLLKQKAGVTIDPIDLDRPGATFEDFGVDSLGLLAVVGELENRHGLSMTAAESAKSSAEFLNTVNLSLKKGS